MHSLLVRQITSMQASTRKCGPAGTALVETVGDRKCAYVYVDNLGVLGVTLSDARRDLHSATELFDKLGPIHA